MMRILSYPSVGSAHLMPSSVSGRKRATMMTTNVLRSSIIVIQLLCLNPCALAVFAPSFPVLSIPLLPASSALARCALESVPFAPVSFPLRRHRLCHCVDRVLVVVLRANVLATYANVGWGGFHIGRGDLSIVTPLRLTLHRGRH